MNICEHLTATAVVFPDRDAIHFEGTTITYAQLDRMSLAASQRLLTAGIHVGDRVAIMLPNVPAFAVWYYAALRIGAIAVSISTRSAGSEVAFLLKDCQARFFVADEATRQTVSQQLPSCVASSVFTSDHGNTADGQSLSDDATTVSTWFDANPNDAALILYTSGTTGFAKGATLSHANVRSNVHAFNHLCNMQPHDRILLAVPLFHCFGQNALLNSALNVGATIVLQRRFDLNESKRLIASERVTQLYGVPMMFQLFLDSCSPRDLASVNYCFSAAATLPIQVSQQWQQKFRKPINEGYGLTETSPFASYNHRLQFVTGSIGTPIDSVEMKIVDPETGETCLAGELGEIVVRGPNVMLGYWNRDEDTRTAIRDGWFHSGDIGRTDERGFFYIVDRVKDMIAVGGLKVFPAEVERVLLDHADIAQVAVVGLPDEVFGEQVVAFVVLAESESPIEERLASIRQYAKRHLANYKVPRIVMPISELPRNPSGKILKRELREFDLQGLVIPSTTPTDTPENPNTVQHQLQAPTLRKKLDGSHAAGRGRVALEFVQNLVKIISDAHDLPNPNDGFLDAGMDSLMIVELSNQIQLELGSGHEIPATLVFDHPRICDLSEYLISAMFPPATAPTVAITPTSEQHNHHTEMDAMSEDEALSALMRELNS
jgi:long-chain acyl-CoA synthetase